MTRKEMLFRELCLEVVQGGIHTDRFTELWLETGVRLEGSEIEVANWVLNRLEGAADLWKTGLPICH